MTTCEACERPVAPEDLRFGLCLECRTERDHAFDTDTSDAILGAYYGDLGISEEDRAR